MVGNEVCGVVEIKMRTQTQEPTLQTRLQNKNERESVENPEAP